MENEKLSYSNSLYEKSGQIDGGAVSAIIMLIVGVGVSVLVLIFVGALGGQTYNLVEEDINNIANNVVTNQAFTAVNNTGTSMGHTYVQSGTLRIFNASNDFEYGLGNFSINYDAGTAQQIGLLSGVNSTSLKANYTWGDTTIRTHVKAGITSGFNALEQTGNYLPIIVLAVVISLVLTLVLGFTAFGSGRGGGVAL